MPVQGGRARWARETFGGVAAGDERRGRRVVQIAAAVAARPAGTVTEVFEDSAEREGAYRLLSNEAVTSASVAEAMFRATAKKCASQERIYVTVDGSSLSVTDRKRSRDVGWVGAWTHGARGMHVVSALALDSEGAAIGVCAQTWWARTGRSQDPHNNFRPLDEKETRFLVETIRSADSRLRNADGSSKAIHVLDRGFDVASVLLLAADDEAPCRFILRAAQNRRVVTPKGSPREYVREVVQRTPILGRYTIEVPARNGQRARNARVQVQAKSVQLVVRVTRKRCQIVPMNAVLVRELDGPKGVMLSWLLLTTESIDTYEKVLEIVRGYAYRWRIEEMHRAWKAGGCNVEDMQLRSREAILKWATIHCAVAARAVRLSRRARTEPNVLATEEFTRAEIDAVIALRAKRTKLRFGDVPDLATMVGLVADAGGYTGKSSGGPPGPSVIARGLERMAIAAEALANAANARKRSDE